jgi:hypothetical protein
LAILGTDLRVIYFREGFSMWIYKGFYIYPASRNSSGIRWYCLSGRGGYLRADTKAGIRELINEQLAND